jgi:hypothetical protein
MYIYLTICISKAQKRKKKKNLTTEIVTRPYWRMPSPTSSFATKSRVAKLDVGLGISTQSHVVRFMVELAAGRTW